MLKVKPEPLEKSSLDYNLFPGSLDGSDQEDPDLMQKITTSRAHLMLPQFAPGGYEIEENKPEEIQTVGEGLALPSLGSDPPGIGMRDVDLGDDPPVPFDLSRPVSEADAEEHYTNPPSIATSTKSTEHLVLPEEEYFSKDNVLVEKIEYEMPVIKQEVMEEENFDLVPNLQAYQQFNVATRGGEREKKGGDREKGGRRPREKQTRKRKCTTPLPPLPPIEIPALPPNFRPPIDILPSVPTPIMRKHPTLSSILSHPPGTTPLPSPARNLGNIGIHSNPDSPARNLGNLGNLGNPDSPASGSTSRRKSKPKQRKIHIEKIKTEVPDPPEEEDLNTTDSTPVSSTKCPTAHARSALPEPEVPVSSQQEVKSLLAKKIRLNNKDAEKNSTKSGKNDNSRDVITASESPSKSGFGSLRTLLSSGPLTNTMQLVTTGSQNEAVTSKRPPGAPRSRGVDQTLADSYMKNWKQTGRFQCRFCPYSSVTKNYLFRHWLVNHNRESAYQCAYCDFCATYKDSITRHQSVNHRDSERHILVDAVLEGKIMTLFEELFDLELGRSGVRRHIDAHGCHGNEDKDEEEEEEEDGEEEYTRCTEMRRNHGNTGTHQRETLRCLDLSVPRRVLPSTRRGSSDVTDHTT